MVRLTHDETDDGGCPMTNYVLDWDAIFAPGASPSNTSIGSVDVTFAIADAGGGAPSAQSATVNSNQFGATNEGHLRLEMTAAAPGEGIVQTIIFEETGFPNEGVRDVAFTLLDVDQDTWQDQVQIIAYDVDGNALPATVVTLTPSGGSASASGDTAQGEADALATQNIGNVEVAIDGEISRIDIVYTAGPDVTSGLTSQDLGIGSISFTSDVIYDDSDGTDDGIINGTDEDNIIFGGTIADGGLLFSGTGADNDSTFPDDTIQAGDGNDTVFGGAGRDSIVGGDGDDDLRGGDGNNIIEGGLGNDRIFGGSLAETISGGADDDVILGGGGTDELSGNGGNDQFLLLASDVAGLGFIDGGADNDVVDITFNATGTTADLKNIVYQNIEFLDFDAGATDATISLLDTQVSGLRAVFFDRLSNSNANTEILEIQMTGEATLNLNPLGVSNFTGNDFFRVLGEDNAENITGTFISDSIEGNGGADTIDGGSGDDTIDGGTGNDMLIGGRGNDSLSGGDGDDMFSGSNREAFFGDTIDGGDGGSDMDVLDLTGLGRWRIGAESDDLDGNSTSGTIEFLNDTGGVEDTLSFSEIEDILCFAEGTLIATDKGQVPVEDLKIGDLLRSADGRSVPVRWVARQTIMPRFHRERAEMVEIKAGALGDGLPLWDLRVTANHGMVLDGAVIDASLLVNGSSIRRVQLAGLPERFTVYHVETDDHDVILANGSASETFIDAVGRSQFDNYQEFVDLFGATASAPKNPLPRVAAKRLLPPATKFRISNASKKLNLGLHSLPRHCEGKAARSIRTGTE